jgi:hypothetical protein
MASRPDSFQVWLQLIAAGGGLACMISMFFGMSMHPEVRGVFIFGALCAAFSIGVAVWGARRTWLAARLWEAERLARRATIPHLAKAPPHA